MRTISISENWRLFSMLEDMQAAGIIYHIHSPSYVPDYALEDYERLLIVNGNTLAVHYLAPTPKIMIATTNHIIEKYG